MSQPSESDGIPSFPNDREYFFDKSGNIYLTLGYIHPKNTIVCVKKYTKVIESQDSGKYFYWKSRINDALYRRNLENYSATSVRKEMENQSSYLVRSELYGVPLTHFPRSEIMKYFNPRESFQMLLEVVRSKKLSELKKLSEKQLLALNICSIFLDDLKIPEEDIGITGSLMLDMDHANSDIDVLIYGTRSTKKFIEKCKQLSQESKGLRRANNTEIFQKAQALSLKSGLSEPDAMDMLYHKCPNLYYGSTYLSVKFCPNESEIKNNPIALLHENQTKFKTIAPVHIRAVVKSVDWAYFYPSLVFIEQIVHLSDEGSDILGPNEISYPIERVLIFEQNFSGYFNQGDSIEIYGLYQYAISVPDERSVYSQMHSKDVGQILVGSKELNEKEFIKRI